MSIWFYGDDATRLEGRVVSSFQWQGEPHVVLEYTGPTGIALALRSEYAVSDRPDAFGFGAVDDDMNADIASLLKR